MNKISLKSWVISVLRSNAVLYIIRLLLLYLLQCWQTHYKHIDRMKDKERRRRRASLCAHPPPLSITLLLQGHYSSRWNGDASLARPNLLFSPGSYTHTFSPWLIFSWPLLCLRLDAVPAEEYDELLNPSFFILILEAVPFDTLFLPKILDRIGKVQRRRCLCPRTFVVLPPGSPVQASLNVNSCASSTTALLLLLLPNLDFFGVKNSLLLSSSSPSKLRPNQELNTPIIGFPAWLNWVGTFFIVHCNFPFVLGGPLSLMLSHTSLSCSQSRIAAGTDVLIATPPPCVQQCSWFAASVTALGRE